MNYEQRPHLQEPKRFWELQRHSRRVQTEQTEKRLCRRNFRLGKVREIKLLAIVEQ